MTAAAYKKDTTAIVSPKDWQRAKGVLTIAAGMEGSERTRLFEERFPNEPVLRTELLTMLAVHDRIKRALGPERTAALSLSGMPLPGTASIPSNEEVIRIGAEYGPYRVVRPIGAGGMGQVFLAEDVRLGRHVALKSLTGRWLASPDARLRLLREARTVAALSHPHIATLFDVLEDKQYFLLVMEYVEGRTAAALASERPIPVVEAVRLAIQICEALIYAHDHGIIHCDLKPLNVQVSPEGTAKVLDFGLARATYESYELDAGAANSEVLLIGTPPYMPPERLLHGTLNVSGDIYSIGVTLFEMVTGRRPFDETDFATLTGAILGTVAPTVSSIVPDSPACLDEVVARALEKDPNQRYETARELCADLQNVLRVIDPVSVASAPAASLTRTIWPYSRALLATVIVLATIIGLTILGFGTSTFYSSPLGLTMAFEGESPLSWPVWGLRSLVLPLAQVCFVVLILGVAMQLWRIVLAAFAPLRHWCERILYSDGKLVRSLRALPISTIAGCLLIAHIVAVVLLLSRFEGVVGSVNNFLLHSGSLAALDPGNGEEHKWYMRAFTLLALGSGWGWYRLVKLKSRGAEPIGAMTLAGGAAVMTLTVFLTIVPYRLFFQGRGERVSYQSQPCYLIGKKANEVMLFCPQSPTWSRLVNLDDPALQRSGTKENIFSATSGNEPKSQKIP